MLNEIFCSSSLKYALWMALNPLLKNTAWFEDFPHFARLLF
jgi:hypothetical protein